MKKLLLTLTMTAALGSLSAQASNESYVQEHSRALKSAEVFQKYLSGDSVSTLNQINWAVGDFHNIKINFLIPGSGRKEVTKEETYQGQAAVWYVNTMTLLGQQQKTEALISRADGKTLRLIVNGKEQDPNQGGGGEEGEVEIIEQAETSVTVPAGTFECFYIKAKVSAQGQQPQILEAWVNPIDVNLDGMLKMKLETAYGPLTMELTEFGPRR